MPATTASESNFPLSNMSHTMSHAYRDMALFAHFISVGHQQAIVDPKAIITSTTALSVGQPAPAKALHLWLC